MASTLLAPSFGVDHEMTDVTSHPEARPQSLVLITVVGKTRMEESFQTGILALDKWEWHLAFREDLELALQRAALFDEHVSKQTHMVLRVTFTPGGIAYFATQYGDAAYQYKPLLHNNGWGCWRFIGDLPLYLTSPEGEVLVQSEWLEIS